METTRSYITKKLTDCYPSQIYYENVYNDLKLLKKYYSFFKIIFIPTIKPCLIGLEITLVNNEIVNNTFAFEEDFLGEYSRKTFIVIPEDYKDDGCQLYGGSWINDEKIIIDDKHYYKEDSIIDYKFCVGVPQSFCKMKNVIYENLHTLENMYIGYEKFLRGDSSKVEFIAYSHGHLGIREYDKNCIERKNGK